MSVTASSETRDNCEYIWQWWAELLNDVDMFCWSGSEQCAKREEVWQQIEELARKNNPRFESLVNQMDYLSLSQKNNDFTLNEDDLLNDKVDQSSRDVSFYLNKFSFFLHLELICFQSQNIRNKDKPLIRRK